MSEQIFTGARIVTPTGIVEGSLAVADGCIRSIEPGSCAGDRAAGLAGDLGGGLDLEGDLLVPGLVEVHTDNLEKQVEPRPKVRWPGDAALMAHDAQVAAAGITTVCDAVCVGFYGGKQDRLALLALSLAAIARGRAAGTLKADHRLHLRCEVSDPHVVELFRAHVDEPSLALVSLMDHTPGQRQWNDLEHYRTFHQGRSGATDAQFDALVRRRIEEQARYADDHRRAIVELCAARNLRLASHDDTTQAHVTEAKAAGCVISEFPTTMAAAEAARGAGMAIVAGAPNVILGGSHSGNVGVHELAARGLLDGLSSDYVPVSLLHAAFRLHERLGWPLARAIDLASGGPARMLGLADRGALEVGLRADLVRVRRAGDVPVVLGVWREGRRVA